MSLSNPYSDRATPSESCLLLCSRKIFVLLRGRMSTSPHQSHASKLIMSHFQHLLRCSPNDTCASLTTNPLRNSDFQEETPRQSKLPITSGYSKNHQFDTWVVQFPHSHNKKQYLRQGQCSQPYSTSTQLAYVKHDIDTI
jgi:hypothetical protein